MKINKKVIILLFKLSFLYLHSKYPIAIHKKPVPNISLITNGNVKSFKKVKLII